MSRFDRSVLTDDVETRTHQKQELADLNDHLATFLKELLRLDWSNQSLEGIRTKWELNVKQIIQVYKDDVTEAERILDGYARDKGALEREVNSIRAELNEIQIKIRNATESRDGNEQQLANLLKQLYQLEAEEKLLEHRRTYLEGEIVALQSQNSRVRVEIERCEQAINEQENLLRNNKDKINGYLKEIERMEEEHRVRMHQKPKHGDGYFTEEVDRAIAEIRNEFERLMSNRSDDLKSLYRSKIQETVKVPVSQSDLEEQARLTRLLKEVRGQINDRIALNNQLRNEIFNIKLTFEKEKKLYDTKVRQTNIRITEQTTEIRRLQERIEQLHKRNTALQNEIEKYRRLLESDKAAKKLELARGK